MIIMDGSCIAQILPSTKQCASTHHSRKYTHRLPFPPPPPHTHTHHDPPRFVEMPVEKGKFELDVEVREGGEILQAGRQRIPDRWSNETERTVANRFGIAFRDFQEFFVQNIAASA